MRPRWLSALAVCAIIPLGLATRALPWLPDFIRQHGGDALWATMVYWGFAFCFPSHSSWRIACIAISFAFLIEASQILEFPWLQKARDHRIGALVLGRGFLWIDLIRYAAGVGLGVAFDFAFQAIKRNKQSLPVS